MKIKEISYQEYGKYRVVLTPNWFEKLLGIPEKTKEYKHTGEYTFGGSVYTDREGNDLSYSSSIGRAIDKHRNKW